MTATDVDMLKTWRPRPVKSIYGPFDEVVTFTRANFREVLDREVKEMRHDMVWDKSKWSWMALASALGPNDAVAFPEKAKAFKRFMTKVVEDIEFWEYQTLWGKYQHEIQAYELEILSNKDKKTRIVFKGQVVLDADEPLEALRNIPKVIEMLHDVHRELLEEESRAAV